MEERMSIAIDPGRYGRKGLYLFFEDSNVLELTEDRIEEITRRFWEDPGKIPIEVRNNADFMPCDICPDAGQETMCYTLRPVLPLLDAVDRFWSYQRVIAVYKGDEQQLLYVSESDMQTALQHICILGLLSYCRVGRKYRKYYYGVIPIMGVEAVLKRLYLNIYWLYRGDMEQIKRAIDQLRQDFWVICGNAVNRLNLICATDSFANSFANIQAATELLAEDMDTVLKDAFDSTHPTRS